MLPTFFLLILGIVNFDWYQNLYEIVSDDDNQEISQSQTADKPMALRG